MAVNRKPHLSYERTTKFNFDIAGLTGIALYGKTAGIIGTGKIGQCMINILKGFGMDIIAYDAFPNPNLGLEYVTLDELYARADVISIHCPLMPATRHMIDKDAIAKMKDGVIFINVARGGLVDSEALADAVEAGKFRGVGMDHCHGHGTGKFCLVTNIAIQQCHSHEAVYKFDNTVDRCRVFSVK